MTILEVNERVCEVLGYTRDEIISKTPMDFGFNDERFADTYKLVMKQLAETGFAKFEMRLKTKSGQMIPAEAITRVIELNGERVSISILRDQKEEEEKLQRANRMLKELSIIDGITGISNRRHFCR